MDIYTILSTIFRYSLLALGGIAALVPLYAAGNVPRYKSQVTLANRRIEAFEIANALIGAELNKF